MRKFIFIISAFCSILQGINALIIEAPNLISFERAIQELDQQSFVLFDVDETLITPKDLILKPCARSAWNECAKETLENCDLVAEGKDRNEYFLGQVLSKIEYELVDPKVINMIYHLQQRNIKTIAFTKMRIGSYGAISSMEDWRIQHLKQHQIDFSSAFPDFRELNVENLETGERALFKQGLLCANKQNKGPVLMAFLKKINWRPLKILFIDNRLDYLKSVETALEGTNIEFIGFHYTDVERRPCIINEDLAKIQLMQLAKTGEWLSDQKASVYLESVGAEDLIENN